MKKVYNLISLFVLTTLLTTSCSDWLDINTDPNKAVEVEPEVLFNYGMISWAGNRCSGDLYIPLSLSAQTQSTGGNFGWGYQNVYDISSYALGNTWKAFYASAGANFKQAIELAETSAIPKPNIAAQNKIAFAELIYSATTLHGDIPYSEAWQVETIPYPKFDSQKDILDNLISLLDEAIGQIDETSSLKMVDYDLAYKGDMEKWIRYANSLKFRIAMLMVDKDPSKADFIKQLLNEKKMINSALGNYKIPFMNEASKENPKYRLLKDYFGGKNSEFYANSYILDPLKATNDPRISKYFDKGKNATEYLGTGTNEDGIKDVSSMVSAYVFRAESPELFFSYQEQLFLEAEVYARGIGVSKDLVKANTIYKEAMIAAMKYFEVEQADIDKYISADLVNLTVIADPVKEIHLQQWLDLMDRPLEAFAQWRRSGKEGAEVPNLSVPSAAVPSQLMRRWLYSPDESTANPNTPESDDIRTKVWFDE